MATTPMSAVLPVDQAQALWRQALRTDLSRHHGIMIYKSLAKPGAMLQGPDSERIKPPKTAGEEFTEGVKIRTPAKRHFAKVVELTSLYYLLTNAHCADRHTLASRRTDPPSAKKRARNRALLDLHLFGSGLRGRP
jgi:hypothetical protein